MRLTYFEIMQAAATGVARNVSALRDGRPLEEGRVDLGWETHVNGAIGEYAVSLALNRPWRPAVGRLDTEAGDVGPYQAKTITRPTDSLIVRPHDADDFPFVLVLLELPTATVIGWLPGADAKVPEFWRERDPSRGVHRAAFFVPQARLRPVEELEAVYA